jgi:hypothetical protein
MEALGVAAALQLYSGERCALFLGLDNAAGLAVYIEQVVGDAKARVEGEFADRHASGGMDVGVCHIADVSAGRS